MALHLNALKPDLAVMIKDPQMLVPMSNHGNVDQPVQQLPGNNVVVVKIVKATTLVTLLLQAVQLHGLVLIVVAAAMIINVVAAKTTTVVMLVDTVVLPKATQLHGFNLPKLHYQILSKLPTVAMVAMRLQAMVTAILFNQAWALLLDLAVFPALDWALHQASLLFFNSLLVVHPHLHHLLQLPLHHQAISPLHPHHPETKKPQRQLRNFLRRY